MRRPRHSKNYAVTANNKGVQVRLLPSFQARPGETVKEFVYDPSVIGSVPRPGDLIIRKAELDFELMQL